MGRKKYARKPKYLKVADRLTCHKISALDSGLHSKRASALLELDRGVTRKEAAQISGLTLNQVQHLITSFQNLGMAIFPVMMGGKEKPPRKRRTKAEMARATQKTARSRNQSSDKTKTEPKPESKQLSEAAATTEEDGADPELPKESREPAKKKKKKDKQSKKKKKEKEKKKKDKKKKKKEKKEKKKKTKK